MRAAPASPCAVLFAAVLLAAAARSPSHARDYDDGVSVTPRGRLFQGGSPDARGERLRPAPYGPARDDSRGSDREPHAWTHGGRRLEAPGSQRAWTHGGRVVRGDLTYGHDTDGSSPRERAGPRWHDNRPSATRHADGEVSDRAARRFGIRSGTTADNARAPHRHTDGGAHAHGWRDTPRERAGRAYPDGGNVPFTHPSLRRGPSVPAPLRRYPEER